MSKQLKFCVECRHSKPEEKSSWTLKCFHPEVNAKNAWALSAAKISGAGCREEREIRWFGSCGMVGKLWEPKE